MTDDDHDGGPVKQTIWLISGFQLGHVKLPGNCLPQLLSRVLVVKVNPVDVKLLKPVDVKLKPVDDVTFKGLILRDLQKQVETSIPVLARPLMALQQGLPGFVGMVTLRDTSPTSLTHTPKLIGLQLDDGIRVGAGVGVGVGAGVGAELTKVIKKRRLRERRNRDGGKALELAISSREELNWKSLLDCFMYDDCVV